jgi:hypothetical protein
MHFDTVGALVPDAGLDRGFQRIGDALVWIELHCPGRFDRKIADSEIPLIPEPTELALDNADAITQGDIDRFIFAETVDKPNLLSPTLEVLTDRLEVVAFVE